MFFLYCIVFFLCDELTVWYHRLKGMKLLVAACGCVCIVL